MIVQLRGRVLAVEAAGVLKRVGSGLIFGLLGAVALAQAGSRLVVGDFSSEQLSGWEEENFDGRTMYRLVEDEGTTVLRATSEDSASGLVKHQRIDLQNYPYLNWRWRIHRRLPPRLEQAKSGDDYPARIYLVVSGGWRFWKSRAVNYVWARSAAKEESWPNAFAGNNVTMIALRNVEDATDTWYEEKRNVLEDLRRIVGPHVRYVDAVALMTDTDNSDSSTSSDYGDIYFSKQ